MTTPPRFPLPSYRRARVPPQLDAIPSRDAWPSAGPWEPARPPDAAVAWDREVPRARHRIGVLRAPLAFAVLAACALAVTWGASVPALARAAAAVAWLQAHDGQTARASLTVVLVAAAALGFVAAWARTTSLRRPVRLADGRGRIAVEAIEERFGAMLMERSDVVDARVEVENRHRRGLWVGARLEVTADARLDETIRAATRMATELVSERIGTRLAGPPQFDLRYDELDLRAGRRG